MEYSQQALHPICRWVPDSVQIPNFSWRITAVFVIEVLKLDYYRADTFGNSGGIIVEKLANRIGLLSSQKHPVLELMFSIIIFTLSFACGMSGQTFSVLHTFTGGSDGATPTSGLTSDGAGNFYGTTRYGGYLDGDCAPNGCGTVFKIELVNGEWILSTLYTFKGETDGFRPEARVVFGQDGALYGTTSGLNADDGDNIGGTIFNLVPPGQPCKSANCVWTKKVLYQFGNTDCTAWSDYETCTYGDLIFDNQGNIYGTTSAGGTAGYGQVYELSRSGSGWIFTTLYSFAIDDDGDFPYGGVIFDRDGNLWGTTSLGPRYGDVPGFGVAFKLTPSSSGWVESWAYLPGEIPYAGLAIDRRGNMFGTTWAGGPGLCTGGGIDVPFQGCGTVFRTSASASLNLPLTIYSFATSLWYPAPGGPMAPVTLDAAGNIYGTAIADENGFGSVFEITASDLAYTSLHDFTGASDGANPISNVTFDSSGNMYGTASASGMACAVIGGGCGTIWEITP